MAITDSLLEASLGTLLFLPGSTLATRDGVDYRVRILVLLVALVVAFAATVPACLTRAAGADNIGVFTQYIAG